MYRFSSDDDVDMFDQFDDIPPRKKQRKAPKKSQAEHVAALAEASGMEAGFVMTYQPARFEAIWLLDSLRSFYEDHLIRDVQAHVKGGKEASLYRCAADESTGEQLLAAKVYRPRQFRNLRNDRMYRDGRDILTAEGRPVKKTDHRLMRAIGKKTAMGMQVTHTSWLMHEYTTLERLHALGAAVPRPFAVNENTLLMAYYGDEQQAAPTLNGIRLERNQARRLFDQVMFNIELMVQHGMIHGDLSAYNLLYWQNQIVLIDFPQVTNSHTNTQAYHILRRDVVRVCEYFAAQGVASRPGALADHLWERYAHTDPDDMAADISTWLD